MLIIKTKKNETNIITVWLILGGGTNGRVGLFAKALRPGLKAGLTYDRPFWAETLMTITAMVTAIIMN